MISNHGHCGVMVKVREGRLFQTICSSLEILTCLLGEVYRMTPVRTTARVSLCYWWEDTCHSSVPGQKKTRATKYHRKEISRMGEAVGVCRRKCVHLCECVCVTGLYESLCTYVVHMCNIIGWFLKRHHKWALLLLGNSK